MSDLESRIFFLEQLLGGRVQYDIQQLKNQVANLGNLLRQGAYFSGGSGGSGGTVYYFSPTAALSGPGGAPGGASPPTSLTNQSMYTISGGAWQPASTTATVYCGLPSGLSATKTAIAILNADGTYSAIAQSCT